MKLAERETIKNHEVPRKITDLVIDASNDTGRARQSFDFLLEPNTPKAAIIGTLANVWGIRGLPIPSDNPDVRYSNAQIRFRRSDGNQIVTIAPNGRRSDSWFAVSYAQERKSASGTDIRGVVFRNDGSVGVVFHEKYDLDGILEEATELTGYKGKTTNEDYNYAKVITRVNLDASSMSLPLFAEINYALGTPTAESKIQSGPAGEATFVSDPDLEDRLLLAKGIRISPYCQTRSHFRSGIDSPNIPEASKGKVLGLNVEPALLSSTINTSLEFVEADFWEIPLAEVLESGLVEFKFSRGMFSIPQAISFSEKWEEMIV